MHFRTDHGLQATYTDPINSTFNAQSDQPQYEGQLQESHTFGATKVNQFILSGSWYSALFSPANLSAASQLMPFRVSLTGNAFYSLGRDFNVWPQGRNVTQYGVVDDFSWQKGSHALKLGVNFRRNDVTDYSPGIGTIGYSFGDSLQSFFNGNGDNYSQNFVVRPTQPIALYGLGLYAQDEWAIKPNFKLTLALRGDHNSDPTCQTNCFARLSDSFLAASHDVNQPYNAAIQTGLHQALANYTNISWQPRIGFARSPFGQGRNTVIRGWLRALHRRLPGHDRRQPAEQRSTEQSVPGGRRSARSSRGQQSGQLGFTSERFVRFRIRRRTDAGTDCCQQPKIRRSLLL